MFPCLLDDSSRSCMRECNAHSAIVSNPPDEINEANEELNVSTSVFSSGLELSCIEEKEQKINKISSLAYVPVEVEIMPSFTKDSHSENHIFVTTVAILKVKEEVIF